MVKIGESQVILIALPELPCTQRVQYPFLYTFKGTKSRKEQIAQIIELFDNLLIDF